MYYYYLLMALAWVENKNATILAEARIKPEGFWGIILLLLMVS